MPEQPDPVLPDPFAKRAAPEKDYDAAIEYLRMLDSEPVHETSADAIANEIIQFLTAWPDDDCIEPKCIRLLRRYAAHCPTIYQQAARWADHHQVLERHWAASILPAIEPEDARVVDWLEHPEIGPWPDRKICPWPNQRHRVIDALLDSWPKGKMLKDRLLKIIRDEQDVYLASDLVRLEPGCPTAMVVYLDCLGSQDPYHDRAHEIIGASYSYLRAIWPAHRNREHVTRALRNHEMLVASTLGPWVTCDERGALPASSRQVIAASRVLFELGYPVETILIALGKVLCEPWMCNNPSEYAGFRYDVAALELLDAMGPTATASLPRIHLWFWAHGKHTLAAYYVLTTIVSIEAGPR